MLKAVHEKTAKLCCHRKQQDDQNKLQQDRNTGISNAGKPWFMSFDQNEFLFNMVTNIYAIPLIMPPNILNSMADDETN